MTIFARNPDTGKAAWAYQKTPHDAWDYDGINENVLADLKINGQDRKVLVNFDRNGFAYVLDRKTGELLKADPFVNVNWATGVDLKTGRPIENPEKRTSSTKPVTRTPGCFSSRGARSAGGFFPITRNSAFGCKRRIVVQHLLTNHSTACTLGGKLKLPQKITRGGSLRQIEGSGVNNSWSTPFGTVNTLRAPP